MEVEFNYSKLRGRIREVYGKESAFASALKIGKVSLSMRLNNKLDFDSREIMRSMQLLDISKDEVANYFFTPVIQKHEFSATATN